VKDETIGGSIRGYIFFVKFYSYIYIGALELILSSSQ